MSNDAKSGGGAPSSGGGWTPASGVGRRTGTITEGADSERSAPSDRVSRMNRVASGEEREVSWAAGTGGASRGRYGSPLVPAPSAADLRRVACRDS